MYMYFEVVRNLFNIFNTNRLKEFECVATVNLCFKLESKSWQYLKACNLELIVLGFVLTWMLMKAV